MYSGDWGGRVKRPERELTGNKHEDFLRGLMDDGWRYRCGVCLAVAGVDCLPEDGREGSVMT